MEYTYPLRSLDATPYRRRSSTHRDDAERSFRLLLSLVRAKDALHRVRLIRIVEDVDLICVAARFDSSHDMTLGALEYVLIWPEYRQRGG